MDLVVVGYLLHDILDVDGTVQECLGGPAAYTSLAAKKLGLKTGIVSKVGKDFEYFDKLEGLERKQLSSTTFIKGGKGSSVLNTLAKKFFRKIFQNPTLMQRQFTSGQSSTK